MVRSTMSSDSHPPFTKKPLFAVMSAAAPSFQQTFLSAVMMAVGNAADATHIQQRLLCHST